MAKNKIYIKNSSRTVNCGLHNFKVIINTDGGRINIDKKYIAKFDADYGSKNRYNNEITLTITEKKEK